MLLLSSCLSLVFVVTNVLCPHCPFPLFHFLSRFQFPFSDWLPWMGDAQCHVIRSFDILLKEKPDLTLADKRQHVTLRTDPHRQPVVPSASIWHTVEKVNRCNYASSQASDLRRHLKTNSQSNNSLQFDTINPFSPNLHQCGFKFWSVGLTLLKSVKKKEQ